MVNPFKQLGIEFRSVWISEYSTFIHSTISHFVMWAFYYISFDLNSWNMIPKTVIVLKLRQAATTGIRGSKYL